MTGLLTGDVTQFPSRMQQLHHQVKEFVNNKIIPLEREIADYHDNPITKWTVNSKIEQLKVSLCVCVVYAGINLGGVGGTGPPFNRN